MSTYMMVSLNNSYPSGMNEVMVTLDIREVSHLEYSDGAIKSYCRVFMKNGHLYYAFLSTIKGIEKYMRDYNHFMHRESVEALNN